MALRAGLSLCGRRQPLAGLLRPLQRSFFTPAAAAAAPAPLAAPLPAAGRKAAAAAPAAATAAAAAAKRGISSGATHTEPLVGRTAPDFEADAYMPSGEVEKISLGSLLQQHDGVCLLFYPLDFSFVCPTELVAFNGKEKEFKEKNWALLGVSVDSVFCHSAWVRQSPSSGGLGPVSFPLVSDLTKSISRSFCLLKDGAVALRGCVLIDKDRVIKHVTINDVSMGRNPEETLRVIDMINYLRTNNKKVCPANWEAGKEGMDPTVEAVIKHMDDANPVP